MWVAAKAALPCDVCGSDRSRELGQPPSEGTVKRCGDVSWNRADNLGLFGISETLGDLLPATRPAENIHFRSSGAPECGPPAPRLWSV